MYSKIHGIFEETYDVEFDETNGSQDEKENLDDVRGVGFSNVMKNMSIGEIKPREEVVDDSIVVVPSTPSTHDEAHQIDEGNDIVDSHDQDQPNASPSPKVQKVQYPRLQRTNETSHAINQVIGDISKGVQTRSRIASFCEHYSFVSFL